MKKRSILKSLIKNGKHFENYRVAVPSEMLQPAVIAAESQSKPGALITPVADFRAPVAAATFDILIERLSNEIDSILPVPVFGVLDNESDWIEILNQFLPPGVTYTVTRSADRKSLDFTFTSGGSNDIIRVSCNQFPYVSFLTAGLDSVFKLSQNKLEISDVAQVSQFSRPIHIFNRSMFGSDLSDTITPNQFKSDLQNQNDMRTINQIITIDKERTLCFLINPAKLVLTMTSFVQAYNKGQSAKSLD